MCDGENTLAKLLPAHFQFEQHGRITLLHGEVRRHVQRERGLAHGGTAGQNDQVGLLEAVRKMIQPGESGLQARNAALDLGGFLDLVQRIHDDLVDRLRRVLDALFEKVEDLMLDILRDPLRAVLAKIDLVGQAFKCRDHAPHQRLVRHDLGIRAGICGGKDLVREFAERVDGVDFRRDVFLFQRILKRDRIDRQALLVQFQDRIIHDPVLMLIKVI